VVAHRESRGLVTVVVAEYLRNCGRGPGQGRLSPPPPAKVEIVTAVEHRQNPKDKSLF
jgi:hypothetical protein